MYFTCNWQEKNKLTQKLKKKRVMQLILKHHIRNSDNSPTTYTPIISLIIVKGFRCTLKAIYNGFKTLKKNSERDF